MPQQDPAVPPRSILLASDLSARCDRALDRAVALAAEWSAELVVLHALEPLAEVLAEGLQRRPRPEDPLAAARARLERDLQPLPPGVTPLVAAGVADAVILETAAARGAGLLVAGLARDETLGRFGLGCTVDALLRDRNVPPLLIVKQRPRGPYTQILVATDLSAGSCAALRTALGFFPGRTLGLFHAYERRAPLLGGAEAPDPAAVAADWADFLDRAGVAEERRGNLDLLAERGDPAELIQGYVTARPIELVVLGTQGRGGLAKLLVGSTAGALLANLPCDVLVVRNPPEG